MEGPENKKEYISQAVSAAEELEKNASELSELKKLSEELSRELSSAIKSRDREIKNTVSSRRREIVRDFDLKISKEKKKLAQEKTAKAKAKEKKVKERISSDTSFLRRENDELKRQFSEFFRENHIPKAAKSSLYYTLFMPKGIKEYLLCALAFAVIFILLPFLVILIKPDIGLLLFALFYLLLILIFGGAYIAIANSTRHKSPEVFKEGRAFRDQINANNKRMRNIAKGIRKDPDEGKYDLAEFEDRIKTAEDGLAAVNEEKKKALDNFDEVTAEELTKEITERTQGSISELEAKIAENSSKAEELQKNMEDRDNSFRSCYGPVLGSENLSLLKLGKLKRILDSDENISLEEAIKKLVENR